MVSSGYAGYRQEANVDRVDDDHDYHGHEDCFGRGEKQLAS